MASQTFFDLKGMLVELEQLELREREVSAVRHELHATLDSGRPNDLLARREQDVSRERRQLHRRIDILRAELRRLNRRPA